MRRAVVLPGRAYPATAPLLALAVECLEKRDYAVRALEWQLDEAPADPAAWVGERLIDAAGDGCDVLVGKSVGCWGAAHAAQRAWPAVWLTPVLTAPECAAAIRANPAPQLVVAGTCDFAYDAAVARDLGCEVYEVLGADHAMSHDGDTSLRDATQRDVAAAIDGFLGSLR